MPICFAMRVWFSKIQAFIFFLFAYFFLFTSFHELSCQNISLSKDMTDTIKHIGQLFTDFLNSLICFNLVHPKIKFHISYWTKDVTDSNLTLPQGGNINKCLLICHKLWDIGFFFFFFFNFSCFQHLHFCTFLTMVKGVFSNSKNLFLWHESVDTTKKAYFQNPRT